MLEEMREKTRRGVEAAEVGLQGRSKWLAVRRRLSPNDRIAKREIEGSERVKSVQCVQFVRYVHERKLVMCWNPEFGW